MRGKWISVNTTVRDRRRSKEKSSPAWFYFFIARFFRLFLRVSRGLPENLVR